MPTTNPTGYETYIYDHKQYWGTTKDTRQHQGALHDPSSLPDPEKHDDNAPFMMIEPCYASESNDVFIHFRNGTSMMLSRSIAEQIRDAFVKVCEKPKQERITIWHQEEALSNT